MLAMKPACERCERPLPHEAEAFICSYECTWCPQCTKEMAASCPNCGGELVRRPIRPVSRLENRPASAERVLKEHPGCAER